MLPLEHPDRIQIAFDATAWSTMLGCFCQPSWPTTWTCGNLSTVTLTSATPQDGRTRRNHQLPLPTTSQSPNQHPGPGAHRDRGPSHPRREAKHFPP